MRGVLHGEYTLAEISCPFCKHFPSILDSWENFERKTVYFFRCEKCKATGPNTNSEEEAKQSWSHGDLYAKAKQEVRPIPPYLIQGEIGKS